MYGTSFLDEKNEHNHIKYTSNMSCIQCSLRVYVFIIESKVIKSICTQAQFLPTRSMLGDSMNFLPKVKKNLE